MVLVTILHTLLSSELETDASSGVRVQPNTLGLTTPEWALTKLFPEGPTHYARLRDSRNHVNTIRASQRHFAPRKNPQELFVTTVSHVTTSASQRHFSTCTPPRNPMEFSMLLCALWGGVVPILRFGPTWRAGPSSVRRSPCCHRR